MRWRRNDQVLWRAVPDHLVLATVDGDILEVDGSAAEVWKRLASWVDDTDLTHALAHDFAVDERVVSSDLQALLHQLHARGYVDAAD